MLWCIYFLITLISSTMYLTYIFKAQSSPVSTVKHPQGQDRPMRLRRRHRHALRSKTVEGKEQGKVTNHSILSVLMFPLPGRIHAPGDGWDEYGGEAGTWHHWRQSRLILFLDCFLPVRCLGCCNYMSYEQQLLISHRSVPGSLWAWSLCFGEGFLQCVYCWLLVVPLHAGKGKKKASSLFIPKTLISLTRVFPWSPSNPNPKFIQKSDTIILSHGYV